MEDQEINQKEKLPNEVHEPLTEEDQEKAGDDILKLTLAQPPMIHPEPTVLYLPTGANLMAEMLDSFKSKPLTVNYIMGMISRWTNLFVNDVQWMEKSCAVESDMFSLYSALADQQLEFESRFGMDDSRIELGLASKETREFVEANSLDILLCRPGMGPLFTAISLMRYARSPGGRDEKFSDQYANLVGECIAVHEANLRIHLGKMGATGAMKEYRSLISTIKKMEFQPSAASLEDAYPSDKSRLLALDLVYTISLGKPRISVRLMKRAIDAPQTDNAAAEVNDGDSGAEDEPCSSESVGHRTRSKSNQSIIRRIETLEADVSGLKQSLNTLIPRHSDCSEESSGSRKRSRSPVIRGRNFQKNQPPRKRQVQGGRFRR